MGLIVRPACTPAAWNFKDAEPTARQPAQRQLLPATRGGGAGLAGVHRAPWERRGGGGQREGNAGSPGGKLQEKHSGEKGDQGSVGTVAGRGGGGGSGKWGRGTLSLRAKRRPGPTSCECYAKGFRLDATGEEPVSLEQEPGAPPPAPSPPFCGSSPSVLGEEVSRETTGPHLQGLMGKEVRQV